MCNKWYHGSCIGLLERPTNLQSWLCPECSKHQSLNEEGEVENQSEIQLLMNYYCDLSLHYPSVLTEDMNLGRGAHDVQLMEYRDF